MSLMKLIKLKFPRTFGTDIQQFFTIDDVRELVELIETKPYIFHKDSKLLTITVDVSEDIKFYEYYNKSNDKTIIDNSIILKEPELK
jgi:hypothetical protein